MSDTTPISNYSEFVSMLQKIYSFETPSLLDPTLEENLYPEDTTLKKSEQERVRDMAQYLFLLPMPYITPEQLHNIAEAWNDKFSVTSIVAGAAALVPHIGIMESAIIATAAQEWALSEENSRKLLQETIAQDPKNSLSLLLQKYVDSQPSTPLKDIDIKQKLSNLSVLSALLETISPEILSKAYLLSEQRIIQTLLDRWTENEAKSAEALREDIKRQALSQHRLKTELLTFLITKSKTTGASPLLFSIVLFGTLFEMKTTTADKNRFGPLVESILPDLEIPENIREECALLAQGILLASLIWAAPSAVSLMNLTDHSQSDKIQQEISAKAYSLSLIRTLEDPSVTRFIQARMGQAVREGRLTREEALFTYSSLRSLLLLNALIALYAQETGGVTAEEIEALIEGKIELPEGSFLRTASSFLQIEMSPLPEKRRESFLSTVLSKLIEAKPANFLTAPTSALLSLWKKNNYNSDVTLATKG